MYLTAENAEDAEKRFVCCKRKDYLTAENAEDAEKRTLLFKRNRQYQAGAWSGQRSGDGGGRIMLFDFRLIIDYCISPQSTQRPQRKELFVVKEKDYLTAENAQMSEVGGQRSEGEGRWSEIGV